MDTDSNSITEGIIGASFRVANELGRGFVEKVYENSLAVELKKLNYRVSQQERLRVYYSGVLVGEFFADLIVNRSVLLEIKAASRLIENHEIQCLNYLKASGLRLGLLLNFGTGSIQIKRLINGF